MVTLIYLAAGASSRFGGRIKALARIGKKDETMLEISMRQAKTAGFNNIVIIASDTTVQPIKDAVGNSFDGIPIAYCLQKTPTHRKKPFGTSHALLSAKELVNEQFVVLNSDDLYGERTLAAVAQYLKAENGYCMPGYKLKNCLPENGTVNRGIITVNDDSTLNRITETFNISRADIPSKFAGDELVSMNLFGVQPAFFSFIEETFQRFLKEHPDDPTTEFLLPVSISEFITERGLQMRILPTDDIPVGLTNPEDEAVLREQLRTATTRP
jgi:NDP-sugar pyrophosphorylase family protein